MNISFFIDEFEILMMQIEDIVRASKRACYRSK